MKYKNSEKKEMPIWKKTLVIFAIREVKLIWKFWIDKEIKRHSCKI